MQARSAILARAASPAKAACWAALFVAAAAPSGAWEQTGPDFYANKQIRMIIGHPVGNDYDLASRFLAKYLTRHIPGEPTIIAQNMPQAASITAANFLFSQAPRDGTMFGSFSRNVPSQARMGQPNVTADPRQFNWLGATSLPSRVCVAWGSAPVKAPADLLTRELIVAGSGAGSSLSILPTVFNHVLGTKFRVIEGYKGTTDAVLAMERGELEGICQTTSAFQGTAQHLLDDGTFRILLTTEREPVPELKVPTVFAYAKTDEQRMILDVHAASLELGRPILAPPNVPADRVAALRRAFDAAMQDRALLEEAKQMKLTVEARSGEAIAAAIRTVAELPAELTAKAARMTRIQQ